MDVHKNARLMPRGRVLMIERINMGMPVRQEAAEAGISERTAHRWLKRWRCGDGELVDRSSAPLRCPHRLRPEQVARIEQLRRQRLTSPVIARALGMAALTVGLALRRLGLNRLARLEAAAGHPLRAATPRRVAAPRHQDLRHDRPPQPQSDRQPPRQCRGHRLVAHACVGR